MNGIRMFSTSVAKNYRAYKAPEFWRMGKFTGLNKSWGRHYHRHSVSIIKITNILIN